MEKSFRMIKRIFSAASVVLLVIAGYSGWRTMSFFKKADHTAGRVLQLVESDGVYHPVVEFSTKDGRKITFRESFGANPPIWKSGETVMVYYLPQWPEKARLNHPFSIWFETGLLALLGVVFGVIAGFMVYFDSAGRRYRKLVRTGQLVEATFKRVEPNPRISLNGRHPYRVVLEWKDPQSDKVYTFYSQNCWQDPTPRLNPAAIRVYIEPGNPGKYYVDLTGAGA